MVLDLKLAIEGDLVEHLRAEGRFVARTITGIMRRNARGLEKDLEAATAAAGLGRLARAWASRVYPKGAASLSPAGLVYARGGTRTQGAMLAFAEGVVIRSKDGFFLAIPTANAPRRGVGGGRISPANFPVDRYGPLRFVYRRRGPSLLVVDDVRASFSRKTGALRGFRRAGAAAVAKGRGTTTVVMFVLVPQARIGRRLDLRAAADKWAARIAAEIAEALG